MNLLLVLVSRNNKIVAGHTKKSVIPLEKLSIIHKNTALVQNSLKQDKDFTRKMFIFRQFGEIFCFQ